MAKTAQLSVVSLYVLSAVVANLLVARFGVDALPFTAFFMVGIDLVARDILHDAWHGSLLWPRMGLMIMGSAVLTWAVSPFAGRVAMGSAVAFASAGMANAAVYHALYSRPRFIRMQASNAVAAVADSVVFPLAALGVLSLSVSASQALAKAAGGLVWSSLYLALRRYRVNRIDKI